jgi:hypothetical protein
VAVDSRTESRSLRQRGWRRGGTVRPLLQSRTCTFPEQPEAVELIEQTGVCNVVSGPGRIGVTIYSLVRPGKYALKGRQTAEGSGRKAA